MDEMFKEMIISGGPPAAIVAIASLLKFVLTLFFLGYGIAAFAHYLTKK